jgi:hypothetical protein
MVVLQMTTGDAGPVTLTADMHRVSLTVPVTFAPAGGNGWEMKATDTRGRRHSAHEAFHRPKDNDSQACDVLNSSQPYERAGLPEAKSLAVHNQMVCAVKAIAPCNTGLTEQLDVETWGA